jgi:hypothetical protein
MKARIFISVLALLSFLLLSLQSGCSLLAPAKKAADDSCKVLKVFPGTEDEQAMCATASDLLDLATMIREARADASVDDKIMRLSARSGRCQIIPTQTVCATDDELAYAISGHAAWKGARL